MAEQNKNQEKPVRINQQIRCPIIRIADQNLVLSNADAQKLAKSKGLDLVEISFVRDRNGNMVSICRICDYGKFQYEKKQKEKAAKKAAKANLQDTKNIQFHIVSDTNDIERKCRQANEFLADNCKVRLEIFMRGREINLKDMADNLMKNILSHFNNTGIIDKVPSWDSRSLTAVVRPIKK